MPPEPPALAKNEESAAHRANEEPMLSVVVPSVNGADDLMDCLEALEAARTEVRLEVLVPDRCGDELRSAVREQFPWVRVLPAPGKATIPDLRAMAFMAARAPHVAVIEDHVLVPPGWPTAMIEARRNEPGEVVIGGSVKNSATERRVDRAAFLCEYSHLLPPLPGGEAEWLTGNNTLYDRAALLRHTAALGEDRWENELHAALRSSGVRLIRRPEIEVHHRKHYSVGEYLHQRYLYARAFAGARLRQRSPAWKMAYGVAALGLPVVLLFRILGNARRGGEHLGELVRSLPLLALFAASWGAGEVVGAWFGPGDAISRVC